MADFIQEQGSTASFEGNQYVELAGTSQEAKPTGDFLSGSVFVEVDTGKVFLYDRGSSEWNEIAGSGGGGGGGTNVVANPTLAGTEDDLTGLQVGDTKYKVGGSSGGGVFFVHAEDNEAGTVSVLDKTWQEIKDASETSVVVLAGVDGMVAGTFAYLVSVDSIPVGQRRWAAIFFDLEGNYHYETTEGANAYPEMIYE